MKKTIIILLVFIMTFSLCACGGNQPPDKEPVAADPNLLECGDFTLLYKGSEIVSGEGDESILIITYDFTNNSKEESSFYWSMITAMTQGDEELETTDVMMEGDTEIVTANSEENVAPGQTLEVYDTVLLKNLEDDVHLIVGEMASDDTDTLIIHLADAVGYSDLEE